MTAGKVFAIIGIILYWMIILILGDVVIHQIVESRAWLMATEFVWAFVIGWRTGKALYRRIYED